MKGLNSMRTSFRESAAVVLGLALCVGGALEARSQEGAPEGARAALRGGGPGMRGRGFGGGFELLRRESARAELKLTDAQQSQLAEAAEKFNAEQQAEFQAGGGFQPGQRPDPAAMQKLFDNRRKAADAKIKDVLSAEQYARYEQLSLHNAGPMGLLRDDVAEA